jgi:hypothetical protein
MIGAASIGAVGNAAITVAAGIVMILVGSGKFRAGNTEESQAAFVRAYGAFFRVGGVLVAIYGTINILLLTLTNRSLF